MQFNKLCTVMRQGLTSGRILLLSSRLSSFSGNNILQLSRPPSHTTVKQIQSRYQRNALSHHQPFIRNLQTTSVLRGDIVEVVTPGFPESITEGDIKWTKAVGDFVKVDEAIGEIETDKTAMPVPAPVAGVIVEFLVPNNGKVGAKQVVVKIKPGAEPASKAAESKPQPAATAAAAAQPPKAAPSAVSPPPREMPPAPSVPKESLSVRPVGTPTPAPVTAKPAAPPAGTQKKGTPGIDYISGSRGEQRVKMSRMRLRIASRLKEAQNTAAMLTTFNECDLSNLAEMRKKHGDAFAKKHGFKLGFMGAFVRASAHALHEQPVVNAMIDDATQEMVYRDYVDISVAVATPKGLVVPVVRGVDHMSFAEIEREIARLGEKARLNQLAIEDMDGGTFTISNGGIFGGLFGTPILNPPQSAILGMYGIQDRVMAINGKPEVRSMMYLALTYDHRLIDGREAVLFLRKVKAVIEDPRLLLLDV